MGDRRARTRSASDVLASVSRTSRALRILSIVAAVYVVALITVASVIGVVNSFRAAEFAEQALAQAQLNGDIAAFLSNCLTPGPDPPNDDRTGTGNACYDALEGNRAAAVRRIIDADDDGTLDSIETQTALERIERALG